MLHLAIICIVCAAFAPAAFNGQKKNESNIFYNFEGGEQNVAKVSFPSVYNVGRNSSDCAKPGLTFFYDYFIKQYQNSKNNSCSIMERVPLGENKNLQSNVDFVYRKRNLLWTTDEKRFQPTTLRPPTSSECSCPNSQLLEKPPSNKKTITLKIPFPVPNLKATWKNLRGKKKFGLCGKECLKNAKDLTKLERCTLSPKDKKLFLCLKRCQDHKHKANLDALLVDDDLDLNKRIKKLVEELAAENHRKKEHLEERRGERRESEIGHQNLKNEDELSPILNNIKKMFIFNKNNVNDRIVGNTKTEPVSSTRVRYPDLEKAENTVSSYDVLRTMRKTIRLRRNPHKGHNSNECSKNREPKYKNNLTGWSNPYSANFKANVNFLYPDRNRKYFAENTKKRRWMKMRMRRNRQKKGLRDWPILKKAFEKLNTLDIKPTYQNRSPASNGKQEGHRSCVNVTRIPQSFSSKDETPNCISEGQKDSESLFKIVKLDSRGHEQGESTTENIMQPMFILNSLEKPLLDKQPREEKLKVIKDIDKFVTEGSSRSFTGLQSSNLLGGVKNQINPLRYLKIRRILRDNIVRNKVEDPKKMKLLYKRSSSAANKNWKSAPVSHTPYVRKDQAEQVKRLVKVIQNMLGNPVPLKCDVLQQSKYAPGCGKKRNTLRGFGQTKFGSDLPYLCNIPLLRSKLFQPFSPNRIVLGSSIPYEPVNAESFHENLFDSSSTLSPTNTLPRTIASAQLNQPETETTTPFSCLTSMFTATPAPVFTPNSATTCNFIRETPPSPVPEPSTARTFEQRIQPSAVNSYMLQESESQNENEDTSAKGTCKDEECTTMISNFSGAPSEEPQIQQRVEDPVPFAVDTRGVSCCADEGNPTAVRLTQQPNSETVDSQYRDSESNEGFKDTEMYNSEYLSENKESTRKVKMFQKLFGNDRRETAFRNKRFYHYKNCNLKPKSRDNKKFNCWIKRFKEKYCRLFGKSRSQGPKKKSKCKVDRNQTSYAKPLIKVNQSSGRHNCCTTETPPGCSGQQQRINDQVFSTPVYVNTAYLPVYNQQTQKIIHQSSDNTKQIKPKNLLPSFGGFHLVGGTYTYTLNPPPEQNRNYAREFSTKPPPKNYGVEPQEEVFLKRQKRSDEYYVWPESDYGDYVYDPQDPEENSGNVPPLKKKGSSDTWIPPSYDMFRELAKAISQTEQSQGEVSKTVSTPKVFDSTGLCLPLSGQPNASTAKTTISLPTTGALMQSAELRDTVLEEATVPTAAVAPPPPSTTASSAVITTASISAIGGRIRSRCKGGRKSYERLSKHSGNSKNLVDSREDKEREIDELVPAEDLHGPTTLKAAVIVRGQKKFQGKPSPKVYMKVFPDSFEKSEQGGVEALISSTARAAETISVANKGQASEQGTASLKSDLRLQILAVCEGYLEVVKLIKAQNQTLGEDTDENLARYCENIISQNFNFHSEKSKKFELNELFTSNANKKDLEKESDSNDGHESYEDFISPYDSKTYSSGHFRDVPDSDNSDDLISKKKGLRDLTSKSQSHVKGRKKRRNVHRSFGQSPKLRRIRKKKEAEEDSEGKGLGKEQKQLIRLLRKRKKALLSWLLSANDGIKPDDLQETDYFDEEDLIDPESDTAQYSGTIKPRRDEKCYQTTQKDVSNSRETVFPVYAKDYGYESGGELMEVEVIWRQVNEKTHENKIFKNLSVLALFLTSTPSPKIKPEETKLVGDDGEIDTDTKWKKNKLAFDAANMEAETDCSNTSSTTAMESTTNSTPCSVSVLKNSAKTSNKSTRKSKTRTIISKPDPTSIVGAPTSANKTHRKISHKYGVAKDIFQEYSIEFLNYAVYILPVMLTILFLLCCLCCALQILKIQKGPKKRKKKKKKAMSSDDTSVSCTSETESKKRKRDIKRKRNSGSKENYDNVHKKKSKTFWNYLKMCNKSSREMGDEIQTEKKKSFLGFLKGKRDDGKPGYSSAPTRETDDEPRAYQGNRERKHYSDQYLTDRRSKRVHDKHRNEEEGEAAERRELIALLEELKKIETDHIEGKKEEKSVQVQSAIPEYDTSLFQPKSQIPDFSYPCEKNVFGMPKVVCPYYNKKFHFHSAVPPSSRDYDLYEEVNELTKLLPWECYPKRNEFLKRCDIKIDKTGRCDRFLKIFRDSGMKCNIPTVDKNYRTSESESRGFIFNKYRSINVDKSEELRGVSEKISGTEVRLMGNVSPGKLSSNRDEDSVEDVEHFKCQPNKKKYVRLKDEGVLCRL